MPRNTRTVFTIAMRLMMLLVLSLFLLLERGFIPVTSADGQCLNRLGEGWYDCDCSMGGDFCTYGWWIGEYDADWNLCREEDGSRPCTFEEHEECPLCDQ